MLTNQEVRNCVYGGKLNSAFARLNNDSYWRKILGNENLDSRQRDVELILRYHSLLDTKNYEKPLKDHMSTFMQKHRNPDDEILATLEERFRAICRTVCLAIGEKPFHLKSGLSTPVFDSVMVAFTKNRAKIPEDINDRYNILIKDSEYARLIREATTDKDNLLKRFKLAETILFGS